MFRIRADSEDEYAASEEEEEEEEGEDSDDGLVDEAEAEAEEGAGGEEDEAGLCASCATRRSESWFSNAAGVGLLPSCAAALQQKSGCWAGVHERLLSAVNAAWPCAAQRRKACNSGRPNLTMHLSSLSVLGSLTS